MAGMIGFAEHECVGLVVEAVSTAAAPYPFVGSGLGNVFLVGVKYKVCGSCGEQSAEIPAVKGLMSAIARTLVSKSGLLTGEQVRFLRKRLPRSSSDFASMLGLNGEDLSSMEMSVEEIPVERDKLVRVIFKFLSKDSQLQKKFRSPEQFEEWLASIDGSGASERMIATWQKSHGWKVETERVAA